MTPTKQAPPVPADDAFAIHLIATKYLPHFKSLSGREAELTMIAIFRDGSVGYSASGTSNNWHTQCEAPTWPRVANLNELVQTFRLDGYTKSILHMQIMSDEEVAALIMRKFNKRELWLLADRHESMRMSAIMGHVVDEIAAEFPRVWTQPSKEYGTEVEPEQMIGDITVSAIEAAARKGHV